MGGPMCLAITGCNFVRPHRIKAGLDTTSIYSKSGKVLMLYHMAHMTFVDCSIRRALGRVSVIPLRRLLSDRRAYNDRDVHDLRGKYIAPFHRITPYYSGIPAGGLHAQIQQQHPSKVR